MKPDDDYQAMKDRLALRDAGRSPRRRGKKSPPSRPAIRLSLRCTCGGTLNGIVSAPITDVFTMRDIFLSFHIGDDRHAVTDTSEDVP